MAASLTRTRVHNAYYRAFIFFHVLWLVTILTVNVVIRIVVKP